tara:strand:- start:708 stop:890 length:183 start_codon:yes stop_codon:yes gene_type:complete
MRKSKSSIPPFLKGKSIKSNKYSRVDSVNLAKDAEVLGVVHSEWEDEPIINAQDYLKDKK